MIPIANYRGDNLEKSSGYLSAGEWICHPDMFSVEGVFVHLETDLTREGRKSLTEYINEQQNPTTNDFVQQIKKLTKEELIDVLKTIFNK